MTDITIKIETEALAQVINRVLSRENHFHANVLAGAIATAIKDAEGEIGSKVRSILGSVVNSKQFEEGILAIYRDAIHGEAARMGRNAARAMVNAKTETKP